MKTIFIVARAAVGESGPIGPWTVWEVPENGARVIVEKLDGVTCSSSRLLAAGASNRLNIAEKAGAHALARERARYISKAEVRT